MLWTNSLKVLCIENNKKDLLKKVNQSNAISMIYRIQMSFFNVKAS